ncbi:hypothetical protein GCM10010423_11080 [Streptomyces levis]|uniref:Uncharacterized protein n=1 Tax=Streptomyces levis TaxID=285566 RepID=A0ABP6AQ58_9ACTN
MVRQHQRQIEIKTGPYAAGGRKSPRPGKVHPQCRTHLLRLRQAAQTVDGPRSQLRHEKDPAENLWRLPLNTPQDVPDAGQVQFGVHCGKAPGRLDHHAVKEKDVLALFRFTQALHRRDAARALGKLVQIRPHQPVGANTEALGHMFALNE